MPAFTIQTDRDAEQTIRDLSHRFRNAILALMLTVAVSTVGFVILRRGTGELDARIFDGLWSTLNLVSTVGSLRAEMSTAERAWSMIVILIGLGAVLYGFGTMQQLVHSGDVVRYYARRRMQRTLDELTNHVVLCGFGVVGQAVAVHMQKAGKQLVVIDDNEDAVAAADELGLIVIQADATSEKSLRQSGVERAAGIVAALDTDASNVYLTLLARELNSNLRIVTRSSRAEARSTLIRAGADRVIVPGELAALQLSHLLLKPMVSEFVAAAFGEGEYDFAEIAVSDYPALAGKTLGELRLPDRAEAVVISVVDEAGKQTFNPGVDRRLDTGDTLLVVCLEHGLERLADLSA